MIFTCFVNLCVGQKREQGSPLALSLGDCNAKCRLLSVRYWHAILGDSRNYMLPILAPSSAKRIATQILVIPKLNGRKDFILRVFVCDIIHPSKELPVQS